MTATENTAPQSLCTLAAYGAPGPCNGPVQPWPPLSCKPVCAEHTEQAEREMAAAEGW